jgi:hypothetical protein
MIARPARGQAAADPSALLADVRAIDPKQPSPSTQSGTTMTHLERPCGCADGEARHDNEIAKSAESLQPQVKPPNSATGLPNLPAFTSGPDRIALAAV